MACASGPSPQSLCHTHPSNPSDKACYPLPLCLPHSGFRASRQAPTFPLPPLCTTNARLTAEIVEVLKGLACESCERHLPRVGTDRDTWCSRTFSSPPKTPYSQKIRLFMGLQKVIVEVQSNCDLWAIFSQYHPVPAAFLCLCFPWGSSVIFVAEPRSVSVAVFSAHRGTSAFAFAALSFLSPVTQLLAHLGFSGPQMLQMRFPGFRTLWTKYGEIERVRAVVGA